MNTTRPSRAPEHRKIVHLFQGVNKFYCRVYHQLSVLSACTLPPSGPAILVCNHISGLDPLLVQSASNRLITWMMAKEYYELPILVHVFRLIQAIPVERSGKDLAATRAAMRALSEGRVLGIFPEGKISTKREILPFQTGVALMARKTGASVFPARLEGTQRGRDMLPALGIACKSSLSFGQPIVPDQRFEGRDGMELFTSQLHDAVQRLPHIRFSNLS